MITLGRGGNGCDIATIRSPLVFRCTSVGIEGGGKNIGGRNSESDITSIGKYVMISIYQRTNGPVNAHRISWPSKANNIQNLENIW